MNMMITEIVKFKIVDGLNSEEFIEIVSRLQEGFHKKQNGYINCELAKGSDGNWAMIMHWDSLPNLRSASKLLMKDDSAKEFRDALIPTSVNMTIMEKTREWNL